MIQFEFNLKTTSSRSVCWYLPPSLRAVFTSSSQVWLQDTSFKSGMDGVAGLGTPEFQLGFVFCRTFLRLVIWSWTYYECGVFGFLLSSAKCESWPAFSLWIFSQTVLLDHHPNSSMVILKTWLPKFCVNLMDRRSAEVLGHAGMSCFATG